MSWHGLLEVESRWKRIWRQRARTAAPRAGRRCAQDDDSPRGRAHVAKCLQTVSQHPRQLPPHSQRGAGGWSPRNGPVLTGGGKKSSTQRSLRKRAVVGVLARLAASVFHPRPLVPLADVPVSPSAVCVDAFAWNGLTQAVRHR